MLLSRTDHQPENVEHMAHKPSWNCRVDGDPWPCLKARADLLEQYRGSNLGMYMVSMLYDYVHERDRADVESPHALFQRFLAWI